MAKHIMQISFSIPSKLVLLIKHFESLIPGTEFRFIGGCIRDSILNRKPKDWDIVTDATPDQLKALGLETVGKGFPVFLYRDDEYGQIEIACCRTERKIGTGHNGFEVTPCQSFEEDAMRRDLTINACAWHHSTPNSIIFYDANTEYDFTHKKLRAMSPAFSEDPLRVFRVARFAAQLSATKDIWVPVASTFELIRSLNKELHTLPPDRVRGEFESAFLKGGDRSSVFFEVLFYGNAIDYWFKELDTIHSSSVDIYTDKTSPYAKEMIYLSLAHALSLIASINVESKAISENIKAFCSRFQIGLAAEMQTMSLLTTFSWKAHSKVYPLTAENLIVLHKSMHRGSVPYEVYMEVAKNNFDMLQTSTTHAYFTCIDMLTLALNNMKFTKNDTPESIKQAKLDCATEFMDLYLPRGLDDKV